MLFYRYPIIYQQLTLTPEEPAVVAQVDESLVADTPVVRRIPLFQSQTVSAEEIPLIETGWDQTYLPPVVLPIKVPPSSTVLAEEIPLSEPGWFQPAPPIVPPFPPIKAPDDTPAFADVPVVAQDQPQFDIPPVVRRLEVFYGDLAFVDQVEPIDSGWVQDYLPPVVPPIKVPFSSVVIVQEVPLIQSGWEQADWAPLVAKRQPVFDLRITTSFEPVVAAGDEAFVEAPPLVLARIVPISTSAGTETIEVVVPPVAAVRLRMLGGGILDRKELG